MLAPVGGCVFLSQFPLSDNFPPFKYGNTGYGVHITLKFYRSHRSLSVWTIGFKSGFRKIKIIPNNDFDDKWDDPHLLLTTVFPTFIYVIKWCNLRLQTYS